jgi:hypothetical protein
VNRNDNSVPIEVFIQALTSQLDRAQDALRLKANAQRPLTFAVKDLTLELRSQLEMSGSVVRIRPAAANETQASMVHLSLTTITRPTIEENTVQLSSDPDEPTLKEMFGPDLSEEEQDDTQRRLEWAGIHTVAQLRELQRRSNPEVLERVTQLPVQRLRFALSKAAQPRVSRVLPDRLAPRGDNNGGGSAQAGTPLLRIRGNNLMRERPPEVRIRGERVPVLQASEREILVAPLPHQLAGTLSIETEPGATVEAEFSIAESAPAPTPAPAAPNVATHEPLSPEGASPS